MIFAQGAMRRQNFVYAIFKQIKNIGKKDGAKSAFSIALDVNVNDN